MPTVVGVSFTPVTKIYYFDPGSLEDLRPGEYVVVQTSQGQEIGQVMWAARQLGEGEIDGELKPVVRRATAVDLVQRDRYQHSEPDVLATCRAKAEEHNLPMRVVKASYSYDGSQLVVSFTADGRVDFRNLVRDLARTFRTRIEMKQIGVRDEAKVLDGVGKCGRQLCCSSWLREFSPVTIKMAKQQNLPLNPSEISGVCGRLLCCLAYEIDTYQEARQRLPKVGSVVQTPDGPGKVRKIHALRDGVTVRLEEDGTYKEYPATDLTVEGSRARGGSRCDGCAIKGTGQGRTLRRERTAETAADQDAAEANQEKGKPDKAPRRARRSRRRRGKSSAEGS